MTLHHRHTKSRFRLRSILLLVNLTVLLLPLLSLFFLRIYENELVRQTEIELISQASILSSVIRQRINESGENPDTYGREIPPVKNDNDEDYYTPVTPRLDLSQTSILPPRPLGNDAENQPDPLMVKLAPVFSAIIEDARRTTLSGIKILDYHGIVIAGSETGADFSDLPEIQTALTGHYASLIRERISDEPPPALTSISRGANIRLFIALPVMQDNRLWGVVYISRTPQNILKHLYEEKEKVFLAALLVVGLTVLLALLTSYAISTPLRRLVQKTSRLAAGDESAMQPMRNPVIREIEILSHSFSDMAQSLHAKGNYIRDFAMHISHEFKTPLTSIQGAAELLNEHLETMDTDKKHTFLSHIISDTDRLKHLVNRLLELARADNTVSENETSSLHAALHDLRSHYQDRHIAIDIPADITHDIVAMARDHLDRVLTNLCDNAVQHGATQITLTVSRRDEQTLTMQIRDNGSGISAVNQEKIFTPFFTTRREHGGTGLGLEIIRSLLEAHHGFIRLLFSDANGSIFEITMPHIPTLE